LCQVDATEILARYIFSKNQYRPSDHTVKYSAFMPPINKRLSVFQITGLAEEEIWVMGGALRAQSVLGRADIKANEVIAAELMLAADDNPPRHVNIVGWPEETSAIKLKAMELAEKAQLSLK